LPTGDLIFLEKMPERIGDRRNPLLDLTGVTRSRFLAHPLALDADIETLRRRTSGRRSLDRKRRKLERRGRLTFTVASGPDAVPAIERLMGWRDRRYDGRPITVAFYRRLLLDTDLARVGVLCLDGEPIGGCFAVVESRVLRLLVSAFDEAMKNWSPGLLAIDAMIGWAVETGLDTFDFTIGSEPFKFAFGVTSEPLWEVRASLGLRGRVLLGLLGARRMAARLVRRSRPVPILLGSGRPTAEESPSP
jgi:CelD/BcsL family acetyltransferase involved in cellulose biosynthesis